jgi:hypothetical protein
MHTKLEEEFITNINGYKKVNKITTFKPQSAKFNG